MILEYLIKDEEEVSAVKNYSSEKIKQEISKVGAIFILIISAPGDNEDSARLLSKVHDEIEQTHRFVVLSNGPSEYFNKSLFPFINEFERKLRKLLYLASVLREKDKISGIENIKDLENKGLGEIFDILFADAEFDKRIRNLSKEVSWKFSKKWTLKHIESLNENTLWYRLLGINVRELSDNYIDVKDYRNDVMHAHNMNYSRYVKIKETFKKINQGIGFLISNTSNPDGDIFEGLRGFSSKLSEVLKEQSELTSDLAKPIIERIEVINKYLSNLYGTTELDEIGKELARYLYISKHLSSKYDMNQNPQDDKELEVEDRSNDDEE